MKKLISLIVAMSYFFIVYAQPVAKVDTIKLSGTTPVNFSLLSNDLGTNITVLQYVVNNTKYSPSNNTRTISNFGKIILKTTGSGTFTPVSTYKNGTINYTIRDSRSRTSTASIVFVTKAPVVDTPIIITPPPTSSQYTLTTASNTSAGVYLLDGTLVRTLWTNKKQNAGTYSVAWDGKDDYGVIVTLPVQKRIITCNITDTWYRNVGNTSSSTALRHSTHRGLRGIFDAVEFNGFLYYCTGLPEGESTTKKTSLATLNTAEEVLVAQSGDINQGTFFLATDGIKVFHAGTDAYNNSLNFVYATDITDKEVLFTSGTSVTMTYGRTYPKAIDVTINSNPITGMAVSTYLYVSHKTGVSVVNKTTGALINTINLNLKDICIDGSFLYGISGSSVNKYTIESTGALTFVSATTYTKAPVAISVSSDVIEVDYGFNDFNNLALRGFVTKGANGTWYGAATQIVRKLNGVENGKIAYVPMLYNVCVDKNNPSRVFANWIEYSVNYTDMSWSIVKDWSVHLSGKYAAINIGNINGIGHDFRDIATVNGKTLAIMTFYTADARGLDVVELTSTGMRTIQSFGEWATISMDLNGDVLELTPDNKFMKYVYNGTSYNAATLVETIPNADIHSGGNSIPTTTKTVVFNPGKDWSGRHLGEVKNGKWLYKVSPSYNYPMGMYYPTSDTFPTGYYPSDGAGNREGYAGGRVYTCDGYVITNYVGEFWGANAGQVNKWNFYKDGLMFYQYGEIGFNNNDGQKMAGNAYMGTVYKVGNFYYIAHADESWWSTIQIAKLDFSSIKIIVVN